MTLTLHCERCNLSYRTTPALGSNALVAFDDDEPTIVGTLGDVAFYGRHAGHRIVIRSR